MTIKGANYIIMSNTTKKQTAVLNEYSKLATIAAAAEAILQAAKINNLSVDEILPIITAYAKRKELES